jgi:peptidoglycan/xylan/chitin deacetylase (PgdA/CDA1 family)
VCLEYGENGDFWRLTPAGARALCHAAFTPAETSCDVFGNVLTSAAFLHGVGCAELTDAEFEAGDPYYPVITGVRARKTTPGPRARARDPRASARGIVLLYHRIDDTPDIHGLGVSPAVFDAQLRWLTAECQVLPLDQLLSTPHDALPERAVALTFDDGYEDNLRTAAPMLQRHHTPASFFLTTRWLDEPGEYWWDLLERALLSDASTPSTLDVPLGDETIRLATADTDQRRSAHWRLHERLVHATLDHRERAVAALRAWSGGGVPRVRPMMADEVRQLAALPAVAIGAHTVNHLALPDQGTHQLVEMTDCQSALARLTGRSADLFAYPYGAVDRRSAALVRRSWRWGLSCDERVLGDSFDAARVPRLDVKSWDVGEFASRVSRLFEPENPPRRAVTLAP